MSHPTWISAARELVKNVARAQRHNFLIVDFHSNHFEETRFVVIRRAGDFK